MKNRFLFLMVSAVCVSSCTAYHAAQQTKKDNKLYGAVITNDRVLPKAANLYNMLHPIVQKIAYIKGKDIVRIDSIAYDKVRDSIIKIECPVINFDSLKKVWTVTIYHTTVDTLIIPDSTCLPQLNFAQLNYSKLQGKYDEQATQITLIKASKNKLMYWLIGISILIFLVIVAIIYNFIRPKIKV